MREHHYRLTELGGSISKTCVQLDKGTQSYVDSYSKVHILGEVRV